MTSYQTVLILDFGSQYTQLIARRVREAGVYSVVLPCTASAHAIQEVAPSAIILSGGPDSVTDTDAPTLPKSIVEFGVPVLGICYGMQLLAHELGGGLTQGTTREYGPAHLHCKGTSLLWKDLPSDEFTVWMSHGDTVTSLPQGFEIIASTSAVEIAAMAHQERAIYAVQFHPEVHHTAYGTAILHNFLFAIAHLQPDWTMSSFATRAIAESKQMVGASNVVLGLSGGIDSTVVAALLHKALGEQLHCIFVDTGLMRHREVEEVVSAFKKYMPGLNLHHVNAHDIFLGRLANVENPEEKRKIIGHAFIEIFEQEAKKIAGVQFLAQGTVYPDIIESYSVKGVVIKSHHNVGGLPEKMNLRLLEPLKELFKDEVRAVGIELGLPEELVWRHPFPGPGLAIRVLGAVSEERLAILRAADNIVQEELKSSGWYQKVWQAFAVLLPLQTVGVMGDARTYDNVVALRIVNSVDAMTADWARLPDDLLARMSSRITSEVAGVNRVVYDISSKPPSTIEWE